MSKVFIKYLLEGNNQPIEGKIVFDSSDHIRFQNGQDVSDTIIIVIAGL